MHSITRRNFLKTGGLGASALTLPIWLQNCRKSKKKPNFIFILIDDLGWKDVRFMGSEYYETPNIDKLAGQGMIFTNAYANAPNCAPTRACFLSGQYQPRHGIYTVWISERGNPMFRKLIPIPNKKTLDPGIVTIAEALKPAEHVCANIGKWHLGQDPESGPVSQGFDLNIGGNRAGAPKSYFSPYKNDVPVIGIDFYPTILEMAGVLEPVGKILDGESLVPLLIRFTIRQICKW